MAKDSNYDKDAADYAVNFIECLSHTKGKWSGKPFELIDWQEQIIRDLFGTLKPDGYRQFNTAYIEIPKKMGKSELAELSHYCLLVVKAMWSQFKMVTHCRWLLMFSLKKLATKQ